MSRKSEHPEFPFMAHVPTLGDKVVKLSMTAVRVFERAGLMDTFRRAGGRRVEHSEPCVPRGRSESELPSVPPGATRGGAFKRVAKKAKKRTA